MADPSRQSEPLGRAKYITPEEFTGRLLPACAGKPDAAWLCWLVGNLGLRIGEAHLLKAGDVDPVAPVVWVSTLKQRGESPPRKPLRVAESVASRLREHIEAMGLETDDLLLPWSKRHSQGLWDSVTTACGLKVKGQVARGKQKATRGRGIHALRHLRALVLADSGAPLGVIQNQLRHSSVLSPAVYVHTAQEARAVESVGAMGDLPSEKQSDKSRRKNKMVS